MNKVYMCIDLKTFFASVECVERNYDPFSVNLVVADETRGDGAICLAVSPKMKAQGVPGRCRIRDIPKHIQYEIALPRMKKYMEYSSNIYSIYLKYISKDDIHVYSIDEVFMDVTHYLSLYQMNVKQLAQMILDDIYKVTGITATVGIGTNLYLCKVALDITAKHCSDNMGILTEEIYQKRLWNHQPLTDFWQVGKGIANRLMKHGIYDMDGVAHCDEKVLYKEFGINAEYLIDHAWGREPTTIADIKRYKPKHNSMSHGQVLFEDYQYEDALLVMKEMVELKSLDLVEHHLVTNLISLHIGYSQREVKSTGGSMKLTVNTNSSHFLIQEFITLFKRTTCRNQPIRRINISFGGVVDEIYESYDLFTDYQAIEEERKVMQAIVEIRNKYGKNKILKGMNFYDKATTRKRNKLVGGHNAE
ncbi:MAG: DNA repair protein [Coprobacillus sp.]